MTTNAEHRRQVEARLDAVEAFVYRNRHVLAPLAWAAALLAIGSGVHALADTSWSWTRWVVWGCAFWFWIITWNAVCEAGNRREKWYLGLVSTTSTVWVSLLAWIGPAVWLLVLGGAGLVGLGIPWAVHRRVKRGVEVDRKIAAWGDGSAVGLPGTRARGTEAGDGWYSFKLRADEAGRYTLSSYRQAAARIAARFGVRSEAVSFASSNHEGEVVVTIRDKERQTVGLEDEDITAPCSVIGPFRVGSTDSGEVIEHAFYLKGRGAQHGACCGASGAGKSSLINRYAGRAARAADALLWMVDMSYGAKELGGWAEACDWFAYTTAHVEAMLTALPKICEARGGTGGRLHNPTNLSPAIVLLIDEGASVWAPDLLPADADMEDRQAADKIAETRRAKAGELLRLARKYGVSIHEATQYGVQDALGGNQAKQQLVGGYGTVFYAGNQQDGHLIIPATHGVNCSTFPQSKPGTCATKGPTIQDVVSGRIDWTDDDTRDRIVAAWADRQPVLEAAAVAAAGDSYRLRNRTAPGQHRDTGTDTHPDSSPDWDQDSAGQRQSRPGQPSGQDTGTVPDFGAAVRGGQDQDTPGQSRPGRTRMSAEQSRQMVLDTLSGFGRPAYPAEVADACGKSKDMVGIRLKELAELKQVTRVRGGKWRRA